MKSRELYSDLKPIKTEYHTSQVNSNGITVNMSGFITTLIKEAARCNNYSSDVIFDIDDIREAFCNYNPEEEFEPIWIGFRRYGVDGTDYVLSRVNSRDDISELRKHYFALYSIDVEKDSPGWCNVIINEYGM